MFFGNADSTEEVVFQAYCGECDCIVFNYDPDEDGIARLEEGCPRCGGLLEDSA